MSQATTALSNLTRRVVFRRTGTQGPAGPAGGGGGGGGSGTVTSASVVTANGVSATVANATTTPAFTFTLGAITPSTVRGLTISTTTGTFTLTNAKTFSVTNTLTLAGTDGSTLNIGTGGTLGTAAFTAASAYEVAGAAAAAQAASQPLDSDLTAIAALTTTSFGRGVLTWANAAAGRTDLGLGTLATQSGTFSGTSSGTNTGDQDLSGYATTAAVAAAYQPLDSDLTAIAALTTTAFGRGALTWANAAAGRADLGLGTLATQNGTFSGTSSGTNTGDQDLSGYATTAAVAAAYQPLDSDLTAIAALTTTAFGRGALTWANAAAGRTDLGLGTLATQSGTFSGTSSGTNSGDVTLAGTPDYITITGQTITRGLIDLATDVTGILTHANLGTGGGGSTKFLREDGTYQTISGGGDALVANTLDQFADVTQTGGATLTISASTTLGGGTHSGTNTGDQTDISGTAEIATTVTVADEAADTSCFLTFVTAATGNLGVKSTPNLTFNASTGDLNVGGAITATTVIGDAIYVEDEDSPYHASIGTATLTANRTWLHPNSDGTHYVGTTATQTLTNKTLSAPVISGIATSDGAEIRTPNAMGALAIDVTKGVNTKTISADSTLTFSATPASGTWFSALITNSGGSDYTLTIPSSFSVSRGSTITTVVIPASGKLMLQWHYDGSIYNIYGDPPATTGTGTFVRDTGGTLNSATITTLTLPTNGQVKLTVPTTDGHATGPTTASFNCGYSSSAVGDLVYLDSSATWQKTDANTTALYNGLLGIALEVKASGAALLVALPGSVVYATGFPALTIGSPLYMSETAGAITHTQPTTTDAAVRVVGWAVHADKMFFFPSPDYITRT